MKKLLFTLVLLPVFSYAQIITTIAGTGSAGSIGDGTPATTAQLNGPADVIADVLGNIYFADYNNNKIRKINSLGIISTFAGTGVPGYTGDGGAATAAQLRLPCNLFFDGTGTLFFADYGNHCIRKINTSGIISTVAGTGVSGFSGDGGAATLAKLSYPPSMYVDVAGNVYISDANNQRIRKVNTSGIISTIAGTGVAGYFGDNGPATAARFYDPYGIILDGAGNIYIADQDNNRIRKIDAAGIVTTFAGTGTPGYFGDGGAATLARLRIPTEIFLDASGNFFIADRHNFCIRKINSIGTISTVTGTGVSGFSGDGGPATSAMASEIPGIWIDPSGTIYLADFNNHRIRKISNCTATISGNTSVCTGATTTLSTSSPGGTWSSGNTTVATADAATGVVTGVTAGTAMITYFSTTGCAGTTTVTVNQSPSTITGSTHICTGSTTTLSNAVSGGTWTSGNTSVAIADAASGVISGVAVGTAIITYSTTGNCSVTTTVTVTQSPSAITGSAPVCVGSTVTLSNAVSSGTWSSGTTAIATVNSVGVVTGVSAGIATISYSVGGCVATTTVLVNAMPSAIPGPVSICAGTTTTLTSTPGSGTWSSNNSAVATVTPGPAGGGVVTGVNTGAATITYTLSGGCFRTATVTVDPSPLAITGTTNVCVGATTTLSNPTTGGTWTSASSAIATINATTGVVSGVSTGQTLISYSNGCIVTTTVTVNASPSAITGNTNICAGSTTTLSSAPGGGTWSSSNTNIATVTSGGGVSAVATGTATITYVLSGGCFRTTTVTVNPLPSAITGNLSVCERSTTTLSNSLSGGVWSSGSSAVATVGSGTGVVTGVTAGNTIISYTKNGCAVTTTVTVKVTPSLTAGTANICTSVTATLTSTPSGGTWSSSNTTFATVVATGAGAGTVTGIAPGNTVITYLLSSGCASTTTVSIIAVLPAVTGLHDVCTGQSILLSNAITGGTWSSSNTTLATATTGTASSGIVTGALAGIPVITYSLGGSCVISTTVAVHATPDPGSITGPSNLCIGTTTTLSNTVTVGTWSSSNSSATISGGVVTAVSAGTDTIRFIVSNSFCADTAIKVINIYPIPNAGAITGPSVVCTAQTITLSDAVAGGVWSSVFPGIATVTTGGIVTGASAGTDTIKYTVSNPGCAVVASKIVSVYDHPAAGTINGPSSVCKGAAFTFSDNITGGVWSSSNVAVATINSITGSTLTLQQGTTVITYTTGPNAGGCFGVATFTLTVTDQATFTIDSTVTQIPCHGDNNGSISVIISGGISPITYLWSNGNTTTTISGLSPDWYTLTVTESITHCTLTDSFRITAPDSLQVTSVVKDDSCSTTSGSVSIEVIGGVLPYSYLWSNNAVSQNLTGLSAGVYSVTVTDHNNCVNVLSATVNEDSCSNLMVHDVITPNGDGINDTWVIEGLALYPSNTVQIFDKWGDIVYEKTGYKNDWGGNGKNGALSDGTYYYLIKLNTANVKGGKNTFTGTLLIKR